MKITFKPNQNSRYSPGGPCSMIDVIDAFGQSVAVVPLAMFYNYPEFWQPLADEKALDVELCHPVEAAAEPTAAGRDGFAGKPTRPAP